MRWSLYITHVCRFQPVSDNWVVLPSCYPTVFGLDWDTVSQKLIQLRGFTARELATINNYRDITFTGKGLLYFAAFHKDAAERVPALRQWLELQQAVEELKGSAV